MKRHAIDDEENESHVRPQHTMPATVHQPGLSKHTRA